MRLDHFRPFARGKKPLLARIGPTWLSAPWRRFLQAAFFVAWLVLFFWVAWPYGSPDYARWREAKEVVDAELFLAIDPLVGLSTAIAGRTWVWSLGFAGVMLAVGFLVPRGFCGYVCPLGTIIDFFDWAVGRRVTRFRVKDDGWWVRLKWFVLAGTLAASAAGVLLTGFVAAIPVVTRGVLFAFGPLITGLHRGWYQVPPMNAGHVVSLVLFAAVLATGFWRPRFWCRYVCPSGALFSAMNALRATERKVETGCIDCGKCVDICPFDAIKPDFTTRTIECTLCQTCGGVCPTKAIKFTDRWNHDALKPPEAGPEIPVTRRGFLAGTAAGLSAAVATREAWGARLWKSPLLPIRPPGSVPEADFLQLCIRCGECFQACPNDVLQPLGFSQGLEGLWTPAAQPNWSGCDPKCNNCGQVCPTGAIRALPLAEKAAAHMGLAVVNPSTCLPWAGREACRMCVDECDAAGYRAIEFLRVRVEVDEAGEPVSDSGFSAPVVLADRCVGCGLCQTRCNGVNANEKKLISRTAIEVLAGPGRDDRIVKGSYLELHRPKPDVAPADEGDYMPDFLKEK